MTTLIIAAHPDDEVLGCGGTIYRLSKSEYVAVLIMTCGDRTRNPDSSTIIKQSHEAAKILGSAPPRLLDFPDQQLDIMPLSTLAGAIGEVITKEQPDTVFTHFSGDLNQDHRAVFQATMIATRPGAGCVQRVYCYHVPSSTEWAFGQLGNFIPNTFLDISGPAVTAKLVAMDCYRSEKRTFPHPRSPEALEAIAQTWGSVCNLAAAEAFMLIRQVL